MDDIITPADWAAENPLTLTQMARLAAETVITSDPSAPWNSAIDQSVAAFKAALLDSPGGTDLDTAGAKFVRAYKANKAFGDDLIAPARDLLKVVSVKVDDDSEDPYLYILMRTDLASMNPGKAVAQGSHAANQMVFEATLRNDATLSDLVGKWSNLAVGFGTCIVLGVTEYQMRETINVAKQQGHHAGITHDPSYPLRDGASFLAVPLDTCGYVFGKKGDLRPIVGSFKLMA